MSKNPGNTPGFLLGRIDGLSERVNGVAVDVYNLSHKISDLLDDSAAARAVMSEVRRDISECALRSEVDSALNEQGKVQAEANKGILDSMYKLRDSTERAFKLVQADMEEAKRALQRFNERVSKLEGQVQFVKDAEPEFEILQKRVAALENLPLIKTASDPKIVGTVSVAQIHEEILDKHEGSLEELNGSVADLERQVASFGLALRSTREGFEYKVDRSEDYLDQKIKRLGQEIAAQTARLVRLEDLAKKGSPVNEFVLPGTATRVTRSDNTLEQELRELLSRWGYQPQEVGVSFATQETVASSSNPLAKNVQTIAVIAKGSKIR